VIGDRPRRLVDLALTARWAGLLAESAAWRGAAERLREASAAGRAWRAESCAEGREAGQVEARSPA
jgi:hypothetical protein